jgi:hypothetical protein
MLKDGETTCPACGARITGDVVAPRRYEKLDLKWSNDSTISDTSQTVITKPETDRYIEDVAPEVIPEIEDIIPAQVESIQQPEPFSIPKEDSYMSYSAWGESEKTDNEDALSEVADSYAAEAPNVDAYDAASFDASLDTAKDVKLDCVDPNAINDVIAEDTDVFRNRRSELDIADEHFRKKNEEFQNLIDTEFAKLRSLYSGLTQLSGGDDEFNVGERVSITDVDAIITAAEKRIDDLKAKHDQEMLDAIETNRKARATESDIDYDRWYMGAGAEEVKFGEDIEADALNSQAESPVENFADKIVVLGDDADQPISPDTAYGFDLSYVPKDALPKQRDLSEDAPILAEVTSDDNKEETAPVAIAGLSLFGDTSGSPFHTHAQPLQDTPEISEEQPEPDVIPSDVIEPSVVVSESKPVAPTTPTESATPATPESPKVAGLGLFASAYGSSLFGAADDEATEEQAISEEPSETPSKIAGIGIISPLGSSLFGATPEPVVSTPQPIIPEPELESNPEPQDPESAQDSEPELESISKPAPIEINTFSITDRIPIDKMKKAFSASATVAVLEDEKSHSSLGELSKKEAKEEEKKSKFDEKFHERNQRFAEKQALAYEKKQKKAEKAAKKRGEEFIPEPRNLEDIQSVENNQSVVDTQDTVDDIPYKKSKGDVIYKAIVAVLVALIIIVGALFVTLKFFPDTKVAQTIDTGFSNAFHFVKGDNYFESTVSSEDSVKKKQQNKIVEPVSSVQILVSNHLVDARDIYMVAFDETAAYSDDMDYPIAGANGTSKIINDYWTEGEDGKDLLYDDEALASVIRFCSDYTAYVGSHSSDIFAEVLKGSEAETALKIDDRALIGEPIKFLYLGIGDVRMKDGKLYVYTRQLIGKAADEKDETEEYIVYELTPSEGTMQVDAYAIYG